MSPDEQELGSTLADLADVISRAPSKRLALLRVFGVVSWWSLQHGVEPKFLIEAVFAIWQDHDEMKLKKLGNGKP